MTSDAVSIISVKRINDEIETEDKNNIQFSLKSVFLTFFVWIFGTIALSVVFAMPWTTIPRTNSIIYQSHWIEAIIPSTAALLLVAASNFYQVTTWTGEKSLTTFGFYLKIYFMNLISFSFLYVLSFVVWSVYLQFNHPLPYLGLILLPMLIILTIGLWFISPSHLLAKRDFGKKLQMYLIFMVWAQVSNVQREVLNSLFTNVPVEFQFLVPFAVAVCRELDKQVRLKLITKMMGVLNKAATALLEINVNAVYSFFIAIRLVEAEFNTVCCTVAIDFILHLVTTYKIIKECKKVNMFGIEIGNTEMNA